MPVSYQAIVQKMKEELAEISSDATDEEVIKQFYAIRSLADVVIGSSGQEFRQTTYKGKQESSSEISNLEAEKMGIPKKDTPEQNKNRLDADDANGDSLFDF
ncbi:YwdI family protein [Halalkalibacillus halophilus]|uniref:YwdI family protein n=1 Tax=Halalkalibacillus halophilus TaxID=392827 RepID=UPI0003FBEDD6|nr:YwdI family protein [Halalkalibacillus halophilus]